MPHSLWVRAVHVGCMQCWCAPCSLREANVCMELEHLFQ